MERIAELQQLLIGLVEMIASQVCLGLIVGLIAKRKDRNFVLWWVYGTVLFIIALIHVLIIKPEENNSNQPIENSSNPEEEFLYYEKSHGKQPVVKKLFSRLLESKEQKNIVDENNNGLLTDNDKSANSFKDEYEKEKLMISSIIDFLEYLNSYFDYIELIGGHVFFSGNSHDELAEDIYYLIDDKYIEALDIDKKIDTSNKQLGGWGDAYYERISKEELSGTHYLKEYYFRIRDKYCAMSVSKYFHTGDFEFSQLLSHEEAEDENVKAVIHLMEELLSKVPLEQSEKYDFYNSCKDRLKVIDNKEDTREETKKQNYI